MFIKNLIAEGEGLKLDFKYQISSASKIAKTLVAFANTEGGRLLIGVKDNGNIVGVSSDEEIYMIELAAEQYCKPPVKVEMEDWKVDGKVVLEVKVPKSEQKPHYAKDETGKWLVYIRKEDENLLANKVLVEVYKREKRKQETVIRYEKPERLLLEYLNKNHKITFGEFCQLAKIPPRIAEKVLVNLVAIGIVDVELTGKSNFFTLKAATV
jgi:predicted HTH transcriptional regulator